MREEILLKLNPNRITGTSGKMWALLGYLLEENFTNPPISSLTITSDGMMLDSTSGFANDFIGDVKDLERNIYGISEVAGLTDDEVNYLIGRIPYYNETASYRN